MFPVELTVNLNFDRYLSFFQAIERKAILENELDEKMKQEVHCMNSDIPKETMLKGNSTPKTSCV